LEYHKINFDNLAFSVLTFFTVSTKENWSVVLFFTQDVMSDWTIINFVAMLLLGSYAVINLVMADILINLDNIKKTNGEKAFWDVTKHLLKTDQWFMMRVAFARSLEGSFMATLSMTIVGFASSILATFFLSSESES
jgi:hypothetical protein